MDRRKHRRLTVYLPMSFSGSDVKGEGVVCDLSSQGCAVETGVTVHMGANLMLEILMPDHDSPMAVDQALVRWTGARRFGVEFGRMRPEQQTRLGGIVKSDSPSEV